MTEVIRREDYTGPPAACKCGAPATHRLITHVGHRAARLICDRCLERARRALGVDGRTAAA